MLKGAQVTSHKRPISSRGEKLKMSSITITFEYPQASPPKYKFGDKVAVKENCPPKNWLTGEVIGLTLLTEVFKPCWWYSIKLDFPPDYTEEHQEVELVLVTEIQAQQVQERGSIPLPKFQTGMRVKLKDASVFSNLFRDFAVVVSSKYVTGKYWSGWTYELTTKNLSHPIEIGENWLDSVPSTTSIKP